MKDEAHIFINNAATNVRFAWVGFDGDDCFNDFHIDVTTGSSTQIFSFGPCAVHGLKKVSGFFRDHSQKSVGLAFRNPDIRCDIFRVDHDYRLEVRIEGSGQSEQIWVRKPFLYFRDEFLAEY